MGHYNYQFTITDATKYTLMRNLVVVGGLINRAVLLLSAVCCFSQSRSCLLYCIGRW